VTSVRGAGDYGFGAPYLIFIPAAVVAGNAAQAIWMRSLWPFVGTWIVLLCMVSGLYTSRRGKFVVWPAIVDGLSLRGDERVLDLGCGRGAVLLIFARRLRTGCAVGVDIWRMRDQSGNAIDATRRNAEADGVVDRIELHTADMSELPFERDSFDLVVEHRHPPTSAMVRAVNGSSTKRCECSGRAGVS